jgi:tRNA pseudouridine38-40 synthase
MGIMKRAISTTAWLWLCSCLILLYGNGTTSVYSYNPNLIRYRCRVAYNGAGFQGFQLQKNTPARTIQGELEQVLTVRFQQPVRVVGAGRTDAGVHARGQAFHFDLEPPMPTATTATDDCVSSTTLPEQKDLSSIEHSLNSMLRADVRLWNLQLAPLPAFKTIGNDPAGQETPVELAWNTIHDSTRKLYCYRISVGAVMEPLERHSRWHPDQAGYNKKKLDLVQLERLLKCYEGTHDFRAFATAIEQLEKKAGRAVDTVRTVYSVDLVTEDIDKGLYRIDFFIKGALYKQVRNMVGTAINICMGNMSEKSFRWLLAREDVAVTRDDNPSKPAPPEGLTLEHVYFDNDKDDSF